MKYLPSIDSMLNEARGRIININPRPSHAEISAAIRKRNLIGIYYQDLVDGDEKLVESGFRLIEPYCLGYGYMTKDGPKYRDRAYLRAYVIMDTKKDDREYSIKRKSVSKTKRVPYWRLFRVDRIETWHNTGKRFHKPRPDYNPFDKGIVDITMSLKVEDFPMRYADLINVENDGE